MVLYCSGERDILSLTEFIGILAGAFTTFGFVPQIVRVFLLRSAREISLPFTLLFLGGVILWLLYGISLDLVPVIFWNAASAILGALLLYAKLKYGG
jgi:MtN3 and saliva related transmembrane protein